jgi:Rrf2 family protein
VKLSKKTEYALRALAELAIRGQEEGHVQAQELARGEKIPVKFLEQILLSLKKAGIVQSRRGAGGGYVLNRSPEGISLGEVIRRIEGPVNLLDCIAEEESEACSCTEMTTCGLRDVVIDVRDAIGRLLDGVTLADICTRTRELRRRQDFVPRYSI